MRIAVTGSIAIDHLMSFPGKFSEQLIADQLQSVSLSFLVDRLEIRRGGVAGNITYGMGSLGLRPVLVGAVGDDFDDYRSWLERHGVDTTAVRISTLHHTARFLCTTDQDLNQIASFYTGAMQEAREIELGPIASRLGGLDLVLVSPNDPDAMLRHTDECRERGLPFVSDPSQQMARMDGPAIKRLVDGAAYLFTNAYESSLIEQKTGWSADDILDRVGTRITTLGSKGARVDRKGEPSVQVPCAPERTKGDPTGVGDAFRAGYLAGVSWRLSAERSAQIGNLVAAMALETMEPQGYAIERDAFLERLSGAYGREAADEVAPHLSTAH
ncbi:MAG: carbohydrate kinase family protein [Streptosporangiales bacterium]|nr:carbohydrate kinase family protein [Streptosporangiales bacterium]